MPKISEQALTFGVALRGVYILARLPFYLLVKVSLCFIYLNLLFRSKTMGKCPKCENFIANPNANPMQLNIIPTDNNGDNGDGQWGQLPFSTNSSFFPFGQTKIKESVNPV
jgi:hypothetical protein